MAADGLPIHAVDISRWDKLREAFSGLTQIVHLAAISDEADWESIRASNIDGTYYVFEAARQAGVRRVIYASSHHVYGFFTIDETLPSDPPYRPSGLYGVSKCFSEALARSFHDKFGMSFEILRIAAAADQPSELRHLGVWVSYDDVIDVIISALQTPRLGFFTLNVVSQNPICVYDDQNWGVFDFDPRPFPADAQIPRSGDRRCGGITCDQWFPPTSNVTKRS